MSAVALAQELVTQLIAAGVRDVVVCPGSRSAPLVYGIAAAESAGLLRTHVRIDERTAGFFALGLAKAETVGHRSGSVGLSGSVGFSVTGGATTHLGLGGPVRSGTTAGLGGPGNCSTSSGFVADSCPEQFSQCDAAHLCPVAVVVTSGTAVANLHPAFLEASHAGVPLIVISADRPHELHGTGANQTTLQQHFFGQAARAFAQFPAGFALDSVRGQVARLVTAAQGTITHDPGPVHLNVAFVEPLTPTSPTVDLPLRPPIEVQSLPQGQAVPLQQGPRTVVVAGDGSGPRAWELAQATQWPLLAEPSSGSRLPGAIRHYQQLLRTGLADEIQRVVLFGHPTLSRTISALLARGGVEVIVVCSSPRWTDVAGCAAAVVSGVLPAQQVGFQAASVPGSGLGSPVGFQLNPVGGALTSASQVDVDPADLTLTGYANTEAKWLQRWQAADAAVTTPPTAIEQAALALWDTEEPLLLGASNTVRAFDAVVPGAQRGNRVLANRGLAGIDGIISTGHGLAARLGEPVRVVLGDLSFQHDLGGLARGELESEVDLDVVVLNDQGGGIFKCLEHAKAPAAVFDRYFVTAPALDVVGVARGLGCEARRITVAELPAALRSWQGGRRVLDVILPNQ